MLSCFRTTNFRRLFRVMLGWVAEPIHPPTENTVIVFPHTSYWDAFLFLLYKDDGFYAFTKPQVFTWWSRSILNKLGFIAAPRLEDRGSGGVSYVCEVLRQKTLQHIDNVPVCFCISPKGTMNHAEWRSGYRNIADTLGWPLTAALFDYESRTVEYVRIPAKTTDLQIQAILSRACPKNPKNAELPVAREYDPYEIIAPFDLPLVTNFAAFVPIAKMVWYQHYAIAAIGTISCICSFVYHQSREKSWSELDRTAAIILISTATSFYGFTSADLLYAILAALFYWCGTGRDCTKARGPYVIYHSLFHVFLSAFATSAIHL